MAGVDRKGWKDQWERIQRFLLRLEEIAKGRRQTRSDLGFYTDIVYATFQNIWHLKDWLKNDPSAKADDVEQFWKSEPSLMLCADLANGSKHLLLTAPKGDPNSKVKSGHINWHPGDDPQIAIDYFVEANGNVVDAWTLANNGKTAWEQYLKGKGLL